jgi:UDP-N-acetylmuramoyl-tripeptide--D-alanyl-D-alanine ligase
LTPSRIEFLSLAEIAAATRAHLAAGPAMPPLVGVGTDTRTDLSGRLFVALRGDRHDAHDHLGAAVAAGAGALLVERVPDAAALGEVPVLVVPDSRRALGDLARAWRGRLALARGVAITGSSGKTTTRRLVEGILGSRWRGTASPKSFNNDLGVPLTLLAARTDDRFLAIEIGMNHPGEIRPLAELARPEVAIVTMVGRAHLEGLGSVEAIATEKASILADLPADGLAIVNGDRAELLAAVERIGLRCPVLRFGRGPGNHLRLAGRRAAEPAAVHAGAAVQRFETSDGLVADLALPGEHNAVNALAAIAAARHLGFDDATIAAALPTVRPEAMRLERIEVGGIGFLNDAYNANPDAVLASLATFAELAADAGRRVAILGDMLELGPSSEALHEEVGRAAGSLPGLGRIEAVGRFAAATLRGAASAGFRGDTRRHEALGEPELGAILDGLRPGDAVLLKGSRGSAMERVLAAARARWGELAARG